VTFALLLRAESVKLLSRLSARLGLVLAGGIGLGATLGLFGLASSGIVVNGAELSQSLDTSAPLAARWALSLRNLWLMQALVLLLATQSFAGELNARTLREELVRPVPRSAVLLAKVGAVALWIALSLLLQYLVACGTGLVLFGADGPWRDVTLGYLGTFLGDLSFAAVAFAAATLVRSVPGTLVGVLLFIVFEKLLAWFLYVAEGARGMLPPDMNQVPAFVDWVFAAQPMLPSAAWGIGGELSVGTDTLLISWAALAIYFVVGLAVADRRFAWSDIP